MSEPKQRSAKCITVFNEKGGSGKTTTSCQLAGTLGLRGYDVMVADLDPQQTAAQWLAMNGGENIEANIWPGFRYGASVFKKIQEFSEKYDLIIADCAPSVEQTTTWGMLLISDLAIIPAQLSPLDMAALPSAKHLARRAMDETGRSIPVRVLANCTRIHMNDDKEFFSQLQEDKEFPPFRTTLGDRKAYSRSMLLGASAHLVKGGEDAVREIEAIADEVLKLVHLPARKSKGK